MPAGTSQKVGRAARVVLVLVALSAVLSVRAAEQPAPPPAADTALRRQVEARFDVVPLRDGTRIAAARTRTAMSATLAATSVWVAAAASEGAGSGSRRARRWGSVTFAIRLSIRTASTG